MEDIMTRQHIAPALFSTNLGEFPPRAAIEPLPPVIVHSNFQEDKVKFASVLRQKYPTQCAAITSASVLEDYFDEYDIHLQTPVYLAQVLQEISSQNYIRAAAIHDFVLNWSHLNQAKLSALGSNLSAVRDVFSAQEQEQLGAAFLEEALVLLRARQAFNSTADPQWTDLRSGGYQSEQWVMNAKYPSEAPQSAQYATTNPQYFGPSSSYGPMVQAQRYCSVGAQEGSTSRNRPALERYQSVQNDHMPSNFEANINKRDLSTSHVFAEDPSCFRDSDQAYAARRLVASTGPLRPEPLNMKDYNTQFTNPIQQALIASPHEYYALGGVPLPSRTVADRVRPHSQSRLEQVFPATRAVSNPPQLQLPYTDSLWSGSRDPQYRTNGMAKEAHNTPNTTVGYEHATGVQAQGNNIISAEPPPADPYNETHNANSAYYLPNLAAPVLVNCPQNLFYPQILGEQTLQMRMNLSNQRASDTNLQGYHGQGRGRMEQAPSYNSATYPNSSNRNPALVTKPVLPLSTNLSYANNKPSHTPQPQNSVANVSNGNRMSKNTSNMYQENRTYSQSEYASMTGMKTQKRLVHTDKRFSKGFDRALPIAPDSQHHHVPASVACRGLYTVPNVSVGAVSEDSRKLFVGNLPSDVTEHSLVNLSSQFGRIEQILVRQSHNEGGPRKTGLWAHITFVTSQDACNALENMRNYMMDGSPLRVNFANPRGYSRNRWHRFPPFNRASPTQFSTRKPSAANNTILPSVQQVASLTARSTISPGDMGGDLSNTDDSPTHLYQPLDGNHSTICNAQEQDHNASHISLNEPSRDRFPDGTGGTSDLNPSHFLSAPIPYGKHDEMASRANEGSIVYSSSGASYLHKDCTFSVPKELGDGNECISVVHIPSATGLSAGRQASVFDDGLQQHGALEGELYTHTVSSRQGQCDQTHCMASGVNQVSDGLTFFSPQDARSDLLGQGPENVINTVSHTYNDQPSLYPEATPRIENGREPKSSTEVPLSECSQVKLSALGLSDDRPTQLQEVDVALCLLATQTSPEKRNGGRKNSCKYSSPIKPKTGTRAKPGSRQVSLSKEIDPDTPSSWSLADPKAPSQKLQKEQQQTTPQMKYPLDEQPAVKVVADTNGSKLGEHSLAAASSQTEVAPASESKKGSYDDTGSNFHQGSSRNSVLPHQKQEPPKSLLSGASKTKTASKSRKKVTTPETQPTGSTGRLALNTINRGSSASNIEQVPALKGTKDDLLGSALSTEEKHASTAAPYEQGSGATRSASPKSTTQNVVAHGRDECEAKTGVMIGKDPTVAGLDSGIQSQLSDPDDLTSELAGELLGRTGTCGMEDVMRELAEKKHTSPKTLTQGDGLYKVSNLVSIAKAQPPMIAKDFQDEVNIGGKELGGTGKTHYLSTPNSETGEVAMGPPRSGPDQFKDATCESSCLAAQLDSRSVFPNLSATKSGTARFPQAEDATPVKLSQSLQAAENSAKDGNLPVLRSGYNSHTGIKEPLENPDLSEQTGKQGNLTSQVKIRSNSIQSSPNELAANQSSHTREDVASMVQPTKPPTWSEVVGRSASIPKNQVQVGAILRPIQVSENDPWAIDKGTSAWVGKEAGQETHAVKSDSKKQVPQSKKANKTERSKRTGLAARKDNMKVPAKKGKNTSSQGSGEGLEGNHQEQMAL